MNTGAISSERPSSYRAESHCVAAALPLSWRDEIIDLVNLHSRKVILHSSGSVTSRELPGIKHSVLTMDGLAVRSQLPWLDALYSNEFLELAATFAGRATYTASSVLHGVNLLAQRGHEVRYEAHVDSNPVQGILGVTEFSSPTGGELVVARNQNACGVAEIEESCWVARPVVGRLALSDMRNHPHYVRSLEPPDDLRIVAVFNYYTDDTQESARPTDLTQHLYGEVLDEYRPAHRAVPRFG